MAFVTAELKDAGFNLPQRKDLAGLNPLIEDTVGYIQSKLTPEWRLEFDMPSLLAAREPEAKWKQVAPGLTILIEGLKKDFETMDADCISCIVGELGQARVIKFVLDDLKTAALANGCLAIAYEGQIIIYWRILPKIDYPHCGKSLSDYIVDNCHGPEVIGDTPLKTSSTAQKVSISEQYHQGASQDVAPVVASAGFIGIMCFKDVDKWRARSRVEPVYVCLNVSEVLMISTIHDDRHHCSEITTKQGIKLYLSFPPQLLLDVISAASAKAHVSQ